MSHKTFYTFILFALITTSSYAQKVKHLTITFKYQFVHDDGEGQLINTRFKVYVDDAVKGVSLEKIEAEANHVTVEIPEGHHKIRAVIESEFEGIWEEHTIANEYSIDCIYLHEDDYSKHVRVDIIFDLIKGTIVKEVKHSNGPFNSVF